MTTTDTLDLYLVLQTEAQFCEFAHKSTNLVKATHHLSYKQLASVTSTTLNTHEVNVFVVATLVHTVRCIFQKVENPTSICKESTKFDDIHFPKFYFWPLGSTIHNYATD